MRPFACCCSFPDVPACSLRVLHCSRPLRRLLPHRAQYHPGNPGFLDVAYATYPEPASDDGWTTLAVVPDYWPHRQAQQTNYSIVVAAPDVDCAHCVLRVRYHPSESPP